MSDAKDVEAQVQAAVHQPWPAEKQCNATSPSPGEAQGLDALLEAWDRLQEAVEKAMGVPDSIRGRPW